MCSLFAAICGRSRLLDLKIDRLLTITLRMEKKMADDRNEVLAELENLKTAVNDRTTKLGEELAAAHAALATAEATGRAAQSMEDKQAAEADKQAQLAKIKEIAAGLVEFSASGN